MRQRIPRSSRLDIDTFLRVRSGLPTIFAFITFPFYIVYVHPQHPLRSPITDQWTTFGTVQTANDLTCPRRYCVISDLLFKNLFQPDQLGKSSNAASARATARPALTGGDGAAPAPSAKHANKSAAMTETSDGEVTKTRAVVADVSGTKSSANEKLQKCKEKCPANIKDCCRYAIAGTYLYIFFFQNDFVSFLFKTNVFAIPFEVSKMSNLTYCCTQTRHTTETVALSRVEDGFLGNTTGWSTETAHFQS